MVLSPRGCPRGDNIVSQGQGIKDLGTLDRYGVVSLPNSMIPLMASVRCIAGSGCVEGGQVGVLPRA